MRAIVGIAVFVGLWLGTAVMCNMGSLVLGLQHPDLPDWWLQLVSWATTLAGLTVAAIGTVLVLRQRKKPPLPPLSYPPR